MELRLATKAFIEHEGKILIVRESNKYETGTNIGSYDVVGGQLKSGEHVEESLTREIFEETGLSVTISKPFYIGEWRPVMNGQPVQIIAIFFICHTATPTVRLSDDHDDYKWIDPNQYKDATLIQNLHAAFEAYLNQE